MDRRLSNHLRCWQGTDCLVHMRWVVMPQQESLYTTMMYVTLMQHQVALSIVHVILIGLGPVV